MRKVTKGFAPLVALALVAAACGGDDDAADEPSEPPAEDTADEPTGDTADEPTEDTADEPTEDTADEPTEDTADEPSEDTGGQEPAEEIVTDFGVTEDTIRIGLNADLSGLFAPLVTQITDAQQVFWEIVNDNGGIAGRQVELVIIDNAYDVPTHLENYAEMADESEEGVIFFSQSTGSPHTAATAEDLVDDDLIAIPLSWYSGFADPGIGQNVMELYTNYCIEAMNGIEYLAGENGATTLGIVSFPGEYGQDGAQGAKIAAEALGLEIVYDGEGAVVPGSDQTPVITELVAADPDLVWATLNPTTLAEVLGGAYQQGLRALWSGNSPTWNYQLLATDLGPIADEVFHYSTYTALWGAIDSPGMTEMIEGMRAKRPDAVLSDTYIVGWTEGLATKAVLEQAAANGDMTRAGVVKAFNEVEVDMKGLAPDQSWFGEPNDFIVRESYIYDVVLDEFDAGATVSDDDVGTGHVLEVGPYSGSIAEGYDFQEACFSG
ncbi:MAG: ABC transporter substrate-binding protein [Ilumatobacteraceae bacterium]|nr:ABC transporter substrate-binding protein [Ilumatobacteraceae bacterium]